MRNAVGRGERTLSVETSRARAAIIERTRASFQEVVVLGH